MSERLIDEAEQLVKSYMTSAQKTKVKRKVEYFKNRGFGRYSPVAAVHNVMGTYSEEELERLLSPRRPVYNKPILSSATIPKKIDPYVSEAIQALGDVNTLPGGRDRYPAALRRMSEALKGLDGETRRNVASQAYRAAGDTLYVAPELAAQRKSEGIARARAARGKHIYHKFGNQWWYQIGGGSDKNSWAMKSSSKGCRVRNPDSVQWLVDAKGRPYYLGSSYTDSRGVERQRMCGRRV